MISVDTDITQMRMNVPSMREAAVNTLTVPIPLEAIRVLVLRDISGTDTIAPVNRLLLF